MMKAALSYYRDTAKPKKSSNKITLGEWNSANQSRVKLRNRKPKAPEIKLSPAEKSLMRLVKNGQVGALIAFHAPAVDNQ